MKKNTQPGASRSKIKDTTTDRVFYIFNLIVWLIVLLIVIYPLYVILISSVSDPYAVMEGRVLWKPVDFSWIGYEAILKYSCPVAVLSELADLYCRRHSFICYGHPDHGLQPVQTVYRQRSH